jgi:hypothetical protein
LIGLTFAVSVFGLSIGVYLLLTLGAEYSTFSTVAVAVGFALVVSLSWVGVWLAAIRLGHLSRWAFLLLYILAMASSCTEGLMTTGFQ